MSKEEEEEEWEEEQFKWEDNDPDIVAFEKLHKIGRDTQRLYDQELAAFGDTEDEIFEEEEEEEEDEQ